MHPLFSRPVRLSFLPILASLTLFTPSARAQSTSWTFGIANWSNAANWTSGEPTADVDAIMTTAGTAQVTMSGETCRNLFVGTAGNPMVSIMAGGSLNVIHRIQVPQSSSGTITQQGGMVTADSLVLGAVSSIGQYQISGGTLSVNSLLIGTAETGSSANFSMGITNPVVNVAHSMTIGRGANIVSGGGTLNVGTTSADSVIVLGAYQMINRPTTNVRNFVMRPLSMMNVTILFNGMTPVISSGTAILDGQLIVADVGAPIGTYELVRGAPLSGAFDTIVLPTAGDWSWRIEGNSLLVTKGPVPVETTTWSRVKAGFGEPGTRGNP